jgi:hypothetical protein
MRYAVLTGRRLFSLIFIIASAEHFSPAAVESAARPVRPDPWGSSLPTANTGVLSARYDFHCCCKARRWCGR